jgi:hypothetical protein
MPAPVHAQRVARLIADLDSHGFAARERATAELKKLGEEAGPAVRVALGARSSPEARQRLEAVLRARDARDPTAEQLLRLRGVEVLERCGTAKAQQFLEPLAQGPPDAALTADARAALDRLVRRPAVP